VPVRRTVGVARPAESRALVGSRPCVAAATCHQRDRLSAPARIALRPQSMSRRRSVRRRSVHWALPEIVRCAESRAWNKAGANA